MIYKKRTKSNVYLIWEQLNGRLSLSREDLQKCVAQVKGWRGECTFDELIEVLLSTGVLVLHDLSLKDRDDEFQIDTLVIFGNLIWIYEVKNYSGSFSYTEQGLCTKFDTYLKDPLEQLKRSTRLLTNLSRKAGFHFTIKGSVVYINPEFYLYDLPSGLPVLFHGQLTRHFESIKKQPVYIGEKQRQFAKCLTDSYVDHTLPRNIPAYTYGEMKKGILCPECGSLEHRDTRQNRVCLKCGHREAVASGVLRNIQMLQLLFPKLPLTIERVHDWCGGIYDKQRIRRVLLRNYQSIGKNKATYYV